MAEREDQHNEFEPDKQEPEEVAGGVDPAEAKEQDSDEEPDEIDPKELDEIKSLLDSKTATASKINTAPVFSGSSSRSSQRIELKGAEKKKWLFSAISSKVLPIFAAVMIVGIIFGGGYFLGAKKGSFFSLSRPQNTGKKVSEQKKKEPQKQENVVQLDKAAVKVDVLNGNGISGESALIGDHLKKSGWTVQNISNADNHNYPQTIIRFKAGFEDAAKLAGKDISTFYPYVAKPDLGADSQASIVIVLGKDKKVTKSTVGIKILNGSGKKGAAGAVAETLKKAGFEVKEVANADKSDYPESVISYKPGQKEMAEKIAKQIEGERKVNLKEDASLDVDIVLLLGLN
jgi:hypothetical protein